MDEEKDQVSSLFEREMQDEEIACLFAQEKLIGDATELIAATMSQLEVSKTELARRVGATKPHISQLLGGTRNMTLRTFADLMHAMGQRVLLASTSLAEDAPGGTMCWVVKTPRRAALHTWDTELVIGASNLAA